MRLLGDKRLSHLLVMSVVMILAMGIAACSDDDVQSGAVQPPQPEQGAPIQVMVVFAPGQLGDRGYADNVMEGVNALENWDDQQKGDTLDVRYIVPYDVEDAKGSIVQWAEKTANPFYANDYERRLLVLTEPYMVGLLTVIKDKLRPTDEVLLLKLDAEDVAQVSTQFGLGNRVHGLNISAALSARKYCKFMKVWSTSSEGSPSGYNTIPVYRLYDAQQYPFRDQLVETIRQEMDETFQCVPIPLSDQNGEGVYLSGETGRTVIEAAYDAANVAQYGYQMSGCPYVIVDLGVGNAGWDYYLLGSAYGGGTLYTLMLDAKDAYGINRFYIERKFGLALGQWTREWMDSPVGAMPVGVTHDDPYYIEDNVYDLE